MTGKVISAPRKKRQFKKKIPQKNLNKQEVAKVAKKEVSKALHELIETKNFYDFEYAQSVSQLGYQYLMTRMIQGEARDQIVGLEAKLTSLYFTYQVKRNVSNDYDNIRIILVQDKDMNAVVPALITEVLYPVGLQWIEQYDIEQVGKRFTILYDKIHTLSADHPSTCDRTIIKDFGNPKLSFTGNWTTAGSVAYGHIYLLAVSDNSVTQPELSFTSAIFYRDA